MSKVEESKDYIKLHELLNNLWFDAYCQGRNYERDEDEEQFDRYEKCIKLTHEDIVNLFVKVWEEK